MTETNTIKKTQMNMKTNSTHSSREKINDSFFVRRSVIESLKQTGNKPIAANLQTETGNQIPATLNHSTFFMKKFLRRSGVFAIALLIASLFLGNNSFGQTTMTRFPLASDFLPDIVNVMSTPTATNSGLSNSTSNLCSGTSGHYFCSGSGDYVDITLNTTGYSGISISWEQKDYNSGGKWNLSGDADNNGSYEYTKTDNASVTSSCATITVNLPSSFDNKGTVHLRLTSANASSSNNHYLDNIVFKGTLQSGYCAGNALSVPTGGSLNITNPNNALGAIDGSYASFGNAIGNYLVLDLTGGNLLNSGSSVAVTWQRSSGGGGTTAPQVTVDVSADNTTWNSPVSGSPFTVNNSSSFTTQTITLNASARYIRFTISNTPNRNLRIDAASYFAQCSPPCTNPTIGTNPSNSTICAGANTSFSVAATGSNLTYQWQVSADGGANFSDISNGGVYSNATTATLNITGATAGMNTYQYRCVVFSGTCSTNSNAATLTVNAPILTTSGTITAVCFDGINPQTTSLAYSAAVNNPNSYSINWDGTANTAGLADQSSTAFSSNAGSGSVPDIAIPANLAAGTYNGTMTLSNGTCTNTLAVSVTVNAKPNASFTYGTNPAYYCLNGTTNPSPTISGDPGGTFTYTQVSGPAGTISLNSTSGVITLSTSSAGVYKITYTKTVNGCTSSHDENIELRTPPTATFSYSSNSFCKTDLNTYDPTHSGSGTGVTGSFSASPAGLSIDDKPEGYPGAFPGRINPSASSPGVYTVTYNFSDALSGCPNIASITITILAAPSITTQPTAPAAVCANNGVATISVVAAGDGLTYQWQRGIPGDFEDITTSNIPNDGATYSGFNSATLTITNAPIGMNGYTYRCVVSGTCAPPVTSYAVALTVNATNTVGAASNSPTVCINTGSVTITHATTGATGIGTPTNLPAGVTAGWSSNTITISGTPTQSGTFNYSIPLTGGCGALNATGTITVTAAPVISMSNSYICLGSVSQILSPTSGGTWVSNNPSVATVANNGTVTAVAAGTVTFTFTDGTTGCSNTTAALTVDASCQVVTLTQPAQLNATISTDPLSPTTVCANDAATITVTITGGTQPYKINGDVQSGAGPFIYTVHPATSPVTTFNNSNIIISDANNCTTGSTTGSVTITVATPIVTLVSKTDVSCNGGSNGAINVSVSGGTGPYTYAWTKNDIAYATTEDLTGLSAGTYKLTVTSTEPCTSQVLTVVINEPAVITVANDGSQVNVSCAGNDGSITLGTVSGGTPNYVYSWTKTGDLSFSASTANLSGLTIGTYNYSVTDANGCGPVTGSITIIKNPAAGPVHNLNTGISYCTIQSAIDDPLTLNGHVISIDAGTYKEDVVVTKELEIKGAGNTTIVMPATSNPNTGSGSLGGTNVFLIQANNVTIHDLEIDGDNPSLTSGQVFGGADIDARNGIITNHASGVYTNLVVYNTTVKNIFLRGIYQSSGGSFNFHHDNVSNVQADPASIAMFAYGSSGVFDHNTVSDANDAISSNYSTGTVFSNNIVTNSASGIHTDNSGSSGSAADEIYGNTVSNSTAGGYGIWVFAPYKNVLVHDNQVTNVDVGMAVAGQAAAGVTPEFYNNEIDGQNKANSTGMYVTTSLFGWGSANVSVDFHNNIVTNNAGDGFYLESEAGYALTINAHNNSITNNSPYAVEKVNTGTFNTDLSCNWWGTITESAISALINGTGVTHIPFLTSGTDSQPGTLGFQTSEVCSTCSLVLTPSATDATCHSNTDGTATVSVSGGTGSYTYAWTGPNSFSAATQSITNLAAGTYNVIVTDANGCVANTSIEVKQPDQLTATISGGGGPTICSGGSANITISISGGTEPYVINGMTQTTGGSPFSVAVSPTVTTTYTETNHPGITITDARGCTVTFAVGSATVNVYGTTITSGVCASCASPVTVCAGANPNSFSVGVPGGGDGNYTYQWQESVGCTGTWVNATAQDGITNTLSFNPPALSQSICYRLQITDGCGNVGYSDTKTYNVVPDPVSPTINPAPADGATVCVGASVSATFNAGSGGTGTITDTYLYSTDGGATWNSYNPGDLIIATTGMVGSNMIQISAQRTASGLGCSNGGVNVVKWSVDALPIVSLNTRTNVSCYGGNNGAINIDVNGGTGPYTYAWSTSDGTIPTGQGIVEDPTGLTAGTYKVIVTSVNNCTSNEQSVTLTQPAALGNTHSESSHNGYNISCNGGSDGSIDLTVTGGVGPYTYSWTGTGVNASAEDQTGLAAGTYDVTVTDANGCQTSASIT
ncbi:MAG: hypothetical protein B6D37_02910, partial [Sphingobacteriales bacterium UTBCD1]